MAPRVGADRRIKMSGIDSRIRKAAVNAALLAAVAVWAALVHPRFAPGLAALAGGQALLASSWRLARTASATPHSVVAFVGLTCLGLTYFVASAVGPPSATRFWVVFAAAAAIFAPVLLLAWRLFARRGRT
jgi:hypothetical protein